VAADSLHCSKMHEGFRKVLQISSSILLTSWFAMKQLIFFDLEVL
jgi:hypothetical protein